MAQPPVSAGCAAGNSSWKYLDVLGKRPRDALKTKGQSKQNPAGVRTSAIAIHTQGERPLATRIASAPVPPARGNIADAVHDPFLVRRGQDGRSPRRGIIRERVCAGVRGAKAKGTRLGRPRRVFRRDEAIRLRAEGKSWRSVAQTLNLPSMFGSANDGAKHNRLRSKHLPFDNTISEQPSRREIAL